jgi:hypothetical protein
MSAIGIDERRNCIFQKWVQSRRFDDVQGFSEQHSLRRTKGHFDLPAHRYLGIEVDDALAIAEQVDV